MATKIFCDSAADFPKGYLKEHKDDIFMVNVPIMIKDEEYFAIPRLYAGEDNSDFYKKIHGGIMATTSAINPQMWYEAFVPVLKQGHDIIMFGFSSKLTASFDFLKQTMETLKQEFPNRKITYIDTLMAALGSGMMVMGALEMLKAGRSDEEIVAYYTKQAQHYKVLLMVDDLKYLQRGGRISKTTAVIGGLLKVKPIIILKEGALSKYGKALGTKRARAFMIESMKKIGLNVADHPIGVMHSLNEKECTAFTEEVRAVVGKDAKIYTGEVCPVIGAHIGPGCLAIIFHAKEKV